MAAEQAVAANSQRVRFNIPAGPAAATLRQFADQANTNIFFRSDEVSAQATRAVLGSLTPREALHRMLEGTELEYRFEAPASFLVYVAEVRLPADGDSCEGSHLGPCEAANSQRDPTPIVTVEGEADSAVPARGLSNIGLGLTPDIVLTRQEFAAAGFQTTRDAIRSIPQNFNGGLNIGVLFAGGTQNTSSQSAASTVNLRGLGSDSTLVLINGYRVAAAEGSDAVDVNLIPLSAVDRIEITTGSASAQYGSDAVAGVVNIVTRNDFQGVELSPALGIATEGGGFLQHYSVVAGRDLGGVRAFGAADCMWQHQIDAQQRSYIPPDIAGTTLTPGIRNCSTLFSATASLSSDLVLSMLGAYTGRSAYQAERSALGGVTASRKAGVNQYAVNTLLQQRLPHSWTIALSAGLSADDVDDPESLIVGAAPAAHLGDRYDNRLWTGQVEASGTLVETHAGAARLDFGVGYNQQDFLFADLPDGEITVRGRRRSRFAFARSAFPLVPSGRGADDPTALSLDGAVRAEQYSDVGKTTSAKIALTYKPASSLTLQASWGTSYRVPSLLERFDTPQAVLEPVPDPSSSDGKPSRALLLFGGNALLRPETSTDTALDLTFIPEGLPGASLRLGSYIIFYRKRIEIPTPNTTNALSDPNVAAFVRDLSWDQVKQIVAQSQFQNLTASPLAAQEQILVIDDRYQNMAHQKAGGVDLLWKYLRDTSFGTWDTSLNVAYLDLQQQVTNESPIADLSGTIFYPPVWRGRSGVSWTYNRYLASLFVNYTGGLREVAALGQPPPTPDRTASWTTFDAQVGLNFAGSERWGSTRLTLSAQNLFNRHPPLIAASQSNPPGFTYDSTNTSPVGLFLTLQLTQTW